jgi:uncharacterized membrane protein YgcG
VATIPYESMGGLPIVKYSLQLARSWGIGEKGKRKDGLLLLIAIKPADEHGLYHGSTRLEVSRSLESEMPRDVASALIADMHEDFIAGRFDDAVSSGVRNIVGRFAQERGFAPPVSPLHSTQRTGCLMKKFLMTSSTGESGFNVFQRFK